MSKEPEFVFMGTAHQGKFYPDRPEWYQQTLNLLDKKRLGVILREEKEPKSLPQLAFFHGILIRVCCMNHPDYAGWTFDEIKSDFITRITAYPKVIITNEGERTAICYDDIRLYSREQMTSFIERVMQMMVEEHDEMVIPDPHEYKLNKYLKDDRD